MINKDMINNYIENEIDFITRYEKEKGKKDIIFLQSLNDEDIEKIKNNINDDEELMQFLNETINYYLYHYKKD